jgi:hypothetical protein
MNMTTNSNPLAGHASDNGFIKLPEIPLAQFAKLAVEKIKWYRYMVEEESKRTQGELE